LLNRRQEILRKKATIYTKEQENNLKGRNHAHKICFKHSLQLKIVKNKKIKRIKKANKRRRFIDERHEKRKE